MFPFNYILRKNFHWYLSDKADDSITIIWLPWAKSSYSDNNATVQKLPQLRLYQIPPENGYMYMYAWVLCCSPETTTLIGYTSIQNKSLKSEKKKKNSFTKLNQKKMHLKCKSWIPKLRKLHAHCQNNINFDIFLFL